MLVLTRKEDETLFIGRARLVIQRISPTKVTLGIDAPADIKVLRGEVADTDPDTNQEQRDGADSDAAGGNAGPSEPDAED